MTQPSSRDLALQASAASAAEPRTAPGEPVSPGPPLKPTSSGRRSRSLRIAGRRYPVVLPSVRDPRLHLAAVIISIHILGQLGLGFQVSVVQILVAILTCAAIELTWTFVQSRSIVWPASAMLTGSGVALILRVDRHAERGPLELGGAGTCSASSPRRPF